MGKISRLFKLYKEAEVIDNQFKENHDQNCRETFIKKINEIKRLYATLTKSDIEKLNQYAQYKDDEKSKKELTEKTQGIFRLCKGISISPNGNSCGIF